MVVEDEERCERLFVLGNAIFIQFVLEKVKVLFGAPLYLQACECLSSSWNQPTKCIETGNLLQHERYVNHQSVSCF